MSRAGALACVRASARRPARSGRVLQEACPWTEGPPTRNGRGGVAGEELAGRRRGGRGRGVCAAVAGHRGGQRGRREPSPTSGQDAAGVKPRNRQAPAAGSQGAPCPARAGAGRAGGSAAPPLLPCPGTRGPREGAGPAPRPCRSQTDAPRRAGRAPGDGKVSPETFCSRRASFGAFPAAQCLLGDFPRRPPWEGRGRPPQARLQRKARRPFPACFPRGARLGRAARLRLPRVRCWAGSTWVPGGSGGSPTPDANSCQRERFQGDRRGIFCLLLTKLRPETLRKVRFRCF